MASSPGIEIEVRPIILMDSVFKDMHGALGRLLVDEVRHWVLRLFGRKCPICD